MKDYPYPFSEFEKHFEDISAGSELEHGAMEGNVIRVFQYMQTQYEDADESRCKMMRFMLVMQYVSQHIAELDTGDFAVVGSERAGALVGRHVLQAVHHLFTTRSLASLGHGPDVAEVKALATTFKGAA